VLSLKDNDQSANLEALIDAGVSSFKIEGRLKGAAYVKNVTAFYRRKLDEIIARRPELSRTSQGDSVFTFEPAPEKVFNRGQTDYFVHGRQYDQPYELAELESPKHAGEPAAVAEEVLPGRIIVKSLPGVTFANGDGLTYLADDEEIRGIAVNRAEPVLNKAGKPIPRLWMLHTLERRRMDGLRPGLVLKRNRDHAFLRMMEGKTAERKIPIDLIFTTHEELVNISAKGLRIVVMFFPIVGFQMVTSNFFQSIGMASKAIFLSISRQVLVLIPCLLILPRFYGQLGVWISMPISDLIASLIAGGMLWWQFRQFRKATA